MDYSKSINEQELLYETKIILSLIYRDFLCSSDEKKRLKEKDERELLEFEELEKAVQEKMQVNFNPDEVFKELNISYNQQIEECKSITVTQEKWYKKIYDFIKNIFKIKQ